MEEYRLKQSKPFSNIMLSYHANYKMIVLNYMGRSDKLREFTGTVESKLNSEGNSMPFDAKQIIPANLMVSYMGIGQLDKASEVSERILNLKRKNKIRLDILTDLYFFQLFLLLQSGSYDLIKSAAQSALRFFRKNKDSQNIFNVEMPIVLLLAKEHNYEDKHVRNDILKKCSEFIEGFVKKVNRHVNFQEHYSLYIIWIKAIDNDISYFQAAEEWCQSFSEEKNSMN